MTANVISGDPAPAPPASTDGLASLALVVERAHAEIHAVLATLWQSRAVIETGTVVPLQRTSAKLHEVSSATETAAIDLLDALDRAQAMVNDLEAADDAGDRPGAERTRDRLRDELFGMVGALQFQDITTQQLAGAANVLGTLETRLRGVVQLFDPTLRSVTQAVASDRTGWAADARTFDPNATTSHAATRQATADAIFAATS